MGATTTAQSPDQPLASPKPFCKCKEALSRAAKTERPVILIGERGTGKELAAARLHLLSGRWRISRTWRSTARRFRRR